LKYVFLHVRFLKAATVGEQVHARHDGTLDVAANGDGQHGLASLDPNHANKVENGGGGVEAYIGGIEDDAGFSSKLDVYS
jgi:hypothetical protein